MIAGGQALVANQLSNAQGNTIGVLLPGMPNATKVQKFAPATKTYTSATYSTSSGTWLGGSGPSTTLNPGEAAFVQNPTTMALNLTFIGNVPQGQQANSGLAATAGQYAFVSSVVPQTLGLDVLNFPAAAGDTVQRWNPANQAYDAASTFNGTTWSPSVLVPAAGEGFSVQSGVSQSRTWTEFLPAGQP